jgi:hypothetical protein
MDKNKIHIQLGDVIHITNPTNEILNDQQFYIDYIDKEKVFLINVKTLDKIKQKIDENGIIGDGTITTIKIIYRKPYSGYARQNNLLPGNWINIHFGGDIPTIIVAKITNLEEDMIEIETLDNDLLFINFDYKGIPEELPIKFIQLRKQPETYTPRKNIPMETENENPIVENENPDAENENPDAENEEIIEEQLDDQLEEEEQKEEIPYKQEIQSQISEADDIIIFKRRNPTRIYATELQERDIDSEIYPIEEQLINLQDDMLASIPTESRTTRVQNNINITLNRYKQLREKFSTFDEYNIVTGKIKRTAKYKPLSEYFNNFNKQLYWLIPVVTNVKKIYDDEVANEPFYKTFILENELVSFIEKKRNSNEGILIDETLYNNYNNLVHEYYKPFENISYKDDIIISKEVKHDMHAMVDNNNHMDSFSSTVINYKNLSNKQFIFDRYTTGLTQHETEPRTTDTNSCHHVLSKVVNMTPNDILDIKSFISLPEPMIRFSKVNLPSTNILDRSLLNQIFVQYWKIFNEKTLLKKYNINLLESEEDLVQKDGNNNYLFPPTIFKNALTQYKLNMTPQEVESMNMSEKEIYEKFIDRIIPKTKFIFNMMKEYMTDKLTFHSIIQYLEPFLVYSDSITYNQYKGIKYFISKKIQKFNEDFIENRKKYGFFKRNVKNKLNPNSVYSLNMLLTLDFKFSDEMDYDFVDETVDTKYGINNYKAITNSEYYKKIMLKDNFRLYTTVLSAQNLQLTYPNDFTPFFQNEKEKLKEVNDKNETSNICKDIVIAKRYTSIEKLENDNKRDVIFDKKYDTTNYNLIDDYEKEVNQMSEESLREHIKKDLMKKQKLDAKDAENLMNDILNGYKMVKAGHYALLEKPDIETTRSNRFIYYKRNENDIWEIDTMLNDRKGELTEPTALCNIQELCVVTENKTKNMLNNELNMPCTDVTKNKSELKQALLEKMIGEFDEKYSKSKKEHEEELLEKLRVHWNNIPKLSNMRTMVKFKYNDFKYQLIKNEDIKLNSNMSPYQKIIDIVLSIHDMIKKCQYILKCKEQFLRPYKEYNNIDIDIDIDIELGANDNDNKSIKESEHWLYCKKSDAPLLPFFRYEMARLYLIDYEQYMGYINTLKQTVGKISDDGDWWIEKNTNWRIMEIDLDTEEGFENDRMVVTRAIIEEDEGNMITLKKEDKSMSLQNTMVINIINALAISMGINIEKEKQHIINLVDDYIRKNVMPKALYIEKNKKVNKKTKTYEEYFNMKLMFFTLSAYLVIVQTMIPAPKTRKTHPGCIRSFSGYPLFEDSDNSMIEYIGCIAYDIKTTTQPWNALNRLKREAIVNNIKEKIKEYLVDNIFVKRRIFQKKQYFVNKALFKTSMDILEELPEQYKVENWESFLPPLKMYSLQEVDNVSDLFKNELTKNLKSGSKEQRKKLLVIQSKIIYFSLLLQKKINNVVVNEEALMYSSKGEKYLENACCYDNLNSTYRYFKNKDKNIHKYNKIVKELSQILDDITLCTKSAILISKIDTKNKYPAVSNKQNQSTIYSAFIHFCRFNYDVPIPLELQPVCHRKPNYNIYSRSDSLFAKIQRLKEDDFNFDLESFLRLMKSVHKNNSIFIDIDEARMSPMFQMIRSIEDYINTIDDTNDTNDTNNSVNMFLQSEFIEKLRAVINNAFIDTYFVNYIESTDTQSVNNLNVFLYKNIDNMMKKMRSFLKSNSQRNNVRHINKLVDGFDKWTLEMSSYEKMNFYKSYIHYFSCEFPLFIKNEQTFSLPQHHYKTFSNFHRATIDTKVKKYYVNLKQFYNMVEIEGIIDKIYDDSRPLLDIVDGLCCYATIDNLNSPFNYDTCNLILKYLLMNILHIYQELCEDDAMIQDANAIANINVEQDVIDIGIQELTRGMDNLFVDETDNIELNSDILEGNKKVVKEKIATLVLTYLSIYKEHKDIIDKSYDNIQDYIFNLKEKEKNMITDRQEKLEGDEKDVDALMKKHKLGVWGKGLNKGLTQYVREDYDNERQFRDTMNEIENKINNKNGVNNDTSGLYDAEIFEEYENIMRGNEMDEEAYDMSHIGDDGDILYDNINEDNYDEYDY